VDLSNVTHGSATTSKAGWRCVAAHGGSHEIFDRHLVQ
jgi:hypothetical protein